MGQGSAEAKNSRSSFGSPCPLYSVIVKELWSEAQRLGLDTTSDVCRQTRCHCCAKAKKSAPAARERFANENPPSPERATEWPWPEVASESGGGIFAGLVW